MIQREVKASHVAKDLTGVVKRHLRREKKLKQKVDVTVSPDIRNGHGVAFSFRFEMPCSCPEDLDCPKPIGLDDQLVIAACLQGDLTKEFAPFLKEVGLSKFQVEAQKPREGAKTYRCTIKSANGTQQT